MKRFRIHEPRVGLVALGLLTFVPLAWTMLQDGELRTLAAPPAAAVAPRGDELLYSRLKLYIEYNSSADDVGVQLQLDGVPWRSLKAFLPDGGRLLDIRTQNSLRLQGMTELFFESSEPPLEDLPLEKFYARFPAGTYEFEGITIEGDEIEGEAEFRHVIPAGPEIIWPPQGDQPPIVEIDDFEIEWEPVTTTIDGSTNLSIVGYQVIVEQLEPRRIFSIDLPADETSVEVPEEFFRQIGALHKFEVLAIEASGNQTITEGEFVIEED